MGLDCSVRFKNGWCFWLQKKCCQATYVSEQSMSHHRQILLKGQNHTLHRDSNDSALEDHVYSRLKWITTAHTTNRLTEAAKCCNGSECIGSPER